MAKRRKKEKKKEREGMLKSKDHAMGLNELRGPYYISSFMHENFRSL